MIVYYKNKNGTNHFKGEEIEFLKMDEGILTTSYTLKLKNGEELKLGLDWRGSECYMSLRKKK